MKKIILFVVFMLLWFLLVQFIQFPVKAETVASGDDLDDLYFLISKVPEDHRIVYAGKIDSETFYLVSRQLKGSCSKLLFNVGKKDELKEVKIHFMMCDEGMSTIINADVGRFRFPTHLQRKKGSRATFNRTTHIATIFLEEFYYLNE